MTDYMVKEGVLRNVILAIKVIVCDTSVHNTFSGGEPELSLIAIRDKQSNLAIDILQ